ncbi:MAG: response regulator [Desulfamplus sp.]|nr:response regulator [Desulfamplus sp.]
MTSVDSDSIVFADETASDNTKADPPWKILIVDDEHDIHYITEKALGSFSFEKRKLFFHNAYSAKEAAQILCAHSDIALILLDVTLETDDAGLQLIHYIRKKLKNSIVQIVIRTGQPGQAPEQKVIEDFEINDYRLKTELTTQRLNTLVTASLRSFRLKSDLRNQLEQRKKTEKEKEKLIVSLKESQRLEALGTLAGGIAHDFNNILGSILGYTQLLQMDVRDNEKGLRYTHQIINGCNRAKNLTMQILEFSRQRESDGNTPKPVLASAMIKEKIKLLQASVPSSIKIRTRIDKNIGYILASPANIHQAVMNLCTNALQAIKDEQGTLTISMENITIAPSNADRFIELGIPNGEYVTISVEDDGKGITPETMDKVFDPYFTTRAGRDGAGLGLSVVHGIMKRCNGAIKLHSTPGKGTIVTLLFPRHIDEKSAEQEESNPVIHKGSGKVLFVDDEQMLVELGKRMIEKLGYQAVSMQSPLNAISLVEKKPREFDLVITDLTMPDMNGIKLAEKIKSIRPDIPVVLITGFSDITTSEKANSSFVDEVLSKPLSINALALILKKFIPGKKSSPSF